MDCFWMLQELQGRPHYAFSKIHLYLGRLECLNFTYSYYLWCDWKKGYEPDAAESPAPATAMIFLEDLSMAPNSAMLLDLFALRVCMAVIYVFNVQAAFSAVRLRHGNRCAVTLWIGHRVQKICRLSTVFTDLLSMIRLRKVKAMILGRGVNRENLYGQLEASAVPTSLTDCRTCPDPCDQGKSSGSCQHRLSCIWRTQVMNPTPANLTLTWRHRCSALWNPIVDKFVQLALCSFLFTYFLHRW
jgi:hypothetical protein